MLEKSFPFEMNFITVSTIGIGMDDLGDIHFFQIKHDLGESNVAS